MRDGGRGMAGESNAYRNLSRRLAPESAYLSAGNLCFGLTENIKRVYKTHFCPPLVYAGWTSMLEHTKGYSNFRATFAPPNPHAILTSTTATFLA